MDVLRAAQLLTDLGFLLLGIAAARAALRVRERSRLDVLLLFGTLAAVVVLQEIALLSCGTSVGCVNVPAASLVSLVLILLIPYALLRLLDDIADIPRWQFWLALVTLLGLAVAALLAGSPAPGWLVTVLS